MHEAGCLGDAVIVYDSVSLGEAVFVCFKLCVSVRAEAHSPIGEGALRSRGKHGRSVPFPARCISKVRRSQVRTCSKLDFGWLHSTWNSLAPYGPLRKSPRG